MSVVGGKFSMRSPFDWSPISCCAAGTRQPDTSCVLENQSGIDIITRVYSTNNLELGVGSI